MKRILAEMRPLCNRQAGLRRQATRELQIPSLMEALILALLISQNRERIM